MEFCGELGKMSSFVQVLVYKIREWRFWCEVDKRSNFFNGLCDMRLKSRDFDANSTK